MYEKQYCTHVQKKRSKICLGTKPVQLVAPAWQRCTWCLISKGNLVENTAEYVTVLYAVQSKV